MSFPKFQRTAVTDAGDVIAGATITVRDQNTGVVSTIYSNRAGTTEQANPFNTLDDGLITFFAREGEYRVEVVGGAGSIEWEYVQLGGTAAILDAQTSTTDATADRLMKVGAFGLGGAIDLTVSDDLNDLAGGGSTGLYFNATAGNTPGNNYPVASAGSLLVISRSPSNTSQVYTTYASGDFSTQYFRSYGSSGWSTWKELYHTGNLNQFEFASSGSDVIAKGNATSASEATFYLPYSSFNTASSITEVGSFEVRRPSGTLIASAVTGFALTGETSQKLAVIEVAGLAGLTLEEPLVLKTTNSSAKITVNL